MNEAAFLEMIAKSVVQSSARTLWDNKAYSLVTYKKHFALIISNGKSYGSKP